MSDERLEEKLECQFMKPFFNGVLCTSSAAEHCLYSKKSGLAGNYVNICTYEKRPLQTNASLGRLSILVPTPQTNYLL